MDGMGASAEFHWIFWTVFGFAMWAFFANPRFYRGQRGCGRRSRSSKSSEIARLKEELDASQSQIAGLKARLEAVETIVTDEENELRREFRRLQET